MKNKKLGELILKSAQLLKGYYSRTGIDFGKRKAYLRLFCSKKLF
jgi:hypothetical protein